MKILIFKIGAIGDTIMSTPFVRQLRKQQPHAQIDYLIGKRSAQVLAGNKNIDHIITFDEDMFFKKQFNKYYALITNMKKERYDCIYVLDKHWIFQLTAKMMQIPVRIGFSRLGKSGTFLTNQTYYGNDKHEIYYYLELLKSAGMKINRKDNKPELHPTKKEIQWAQNFLTKHKITVHNHKLIIIAPGGGKNAGEQTEIRNWPLTKYVALINTIQKKYSNYIVIIVGNPADKEKEDAILKKISSKIGTHPQIYGLCGKTTIGQTATLISYANVIICNDSGSMHIASAMNEHIISIFGPTNPKRKAPLSKKAMALWKDQKQYEPSYELFGKKPKGIFFEKISVENVMDAINNMIQNNNTIKKNATTSLTNKRQ